MRKKIIALAILIITFLSVSSFATAKENNYTGWVFPIVPETEEWLEAWENEDKQEVLSMLQIPEDILAEMTTEELTEVVLQYPFLVDMHFFSSFSEGLECVLKDFNGARELVAREDASYYSLKHYNTTKSKRSTGDSELLQRQIAIFLTLSNVCSDLTANEIEEIEIDI